MEAQRSPDDGEKEKGFLWQVVQIMLIIWTFLCELPEILTLVSTCSCFKPVVAYFKRNFMRVNFIGSSHIYYHKSNYLSLTTILTHREKCLFFLYGVWPRSIPFCVYSLVPGGWHLMLCNLFRLTKFDTFRHYSNFCSHFVNGAWPLRWVRRGVWRFEQRRELPLPLFCL